MFFQGNNQFSKEDFFRAVEDENQPEVERLLNLSGANINVRKDVFSGQETALHALIIDGDANIELLNYLLNRGLDWNIINEDGETGMHFTAVYDDVGAANILLARGASFDVRCYKNRTPLHLAARYFSPNMIDFLLENNADVNAVDNEGNTPLHLLVLVAIEDHSDDINVVLESVKSLLDNEADTTITNDAGNTALDLLEDPSELKTLLEETLVMQGVAKVKMIFP